jgi:HSP20 family protein
MVYPTLWRAGRPAAWEDLFNARRDVDRIFDRFFNGAPSAVTVWSPSVDVRESKDDIAVSVELPGLRREDVNLTVENNVLTISGEKKQEFEEGKEDGDYHLIERCYGKFERSFTLPRSVDPENITARFDDGVLKVVLSKIPAAKPKQIAIK